MTVVILLLALSAGPARARSACADLKPKQELDEGPMKLINAAIQAAQVATGTTAQATSQNEEAVSLLREDDLAKAWFLYQICT